MLTALHTTTLWSHRSWRWPVERCPEQTLRNTQWSNVHLPIEFWAFGVNRRNYPDPMNPVALITGASRGIGRGIALEVARLGYDLVINYVKNGHAAQTTADECASFAKTVGKT